MTNLIRNTTKFSDEHYLFLCSCTNPDHVFDVYIETSTIKEEDSTEIFLYATMKFSWKETKHFWARLKLIYKLLLNKEVKIETDILVPTETSLKLGELLIERSTK